MDDDVCGVLLEPIQGEGGVYVPPADYLAKVKELCTKHDSLLIYDEVQTGFCRTGKWFAWMISGVKPDILTMAKAIGGGVPMGAFAVDEKLAHVFAPGDHGTTFGGNCLACAASYAAISTMRAEGLDKVAAKTGAYFKQGLQEIAKAFPDKVKEVRGEGLILGMEMTKPAGSLVKTAQDRGCIINCTAGNVLRFVPPLIITEADIAKLLVVLKEIIKDF